MDSIKILSQACTHFYTGLHSPPYVILRRQGRLHEQPRPARDRSHLLHPRKYLCLTTNELFGRAHYQTDPNHQNKIRKKWRISPRRRSLLALQNLAVLFLLQDHERNDRDEIINSRLMWRGVGDTQLQSRPTQRCCLFISSVHLVICNC